MSGWIKLHRSTLEWEWYTDANTFRVFMHILLNANIEPRRYRGIEVPIGSLVAGRQALASQLGMSEQSVRTALDHLGRSEITIKSTSKFSIISINKWSEYQGNQPADNQQLTNNQPTTNQQLTTPKEYKNKERRIKNIYTPPDVSETVWNDFVEHRKSKKAPVTETVIDNLRNEASKAGWTLEEALKETCARGWQGFKAEWVNKENIYGNKHKNSTASTLDKTQFAAAQALAELRQEASMDSGGMGLSGWEDGQEVGGVLPRKSPVAVGDDETLALPFTPDSDNA